MQENSPDCGIGAIGAFRHRMFAPVQLCFRGASSRALRSGTYNRADSAPDGPGVRVRLPRSHRRASVPLPLCPAKARMRSRRQSSLPQPVFAPRLCERWPNGSWFPCRSPVVPLAVERGRVEIRIADAEGTADHFGRFMVLPYGNIMILWFQRTVICSRTVTCYYLSRPGS